MKTLTNWFRNGLETGAAISALGIWLVEALLLRFVIPGRMAALVTVVPALLFLLGAIWSIRHLRLLIQPRIYIITRSLEALVKASFAGVLLAAILHNFFSVDWSLTAAAALAVIYFSLQVRSIVQSARLIGGATSLFGSMFGAVESDLGQIAKDFGSGSITDDEQEQPVSK